MVMVMLHHTSGSNHLIIMGEGAIEFFFKNNNSLINDHEVEVSNTSMTTENVKLQLKIKVCFEKNHMSTPFQLQITKTKYPINIVDQQKGRQEWSSS
jgi:hypothetical protein